MLIILFYYASSFFFLIISLYFLIPTVITQILNLTTELAMPIGVPDKEAKVEIGTHSVTIEADISKCSM